MMDGDDVFGGRKVEVPEGKEGWACRREWRRREEGEVRGKERPKVYVVKEMCWS